MPHIPKFIVGDYIAFTKARLESGFGAGMSIKKAVLKHLKPNSFRVNAIYTCAQYHATHNGIDCSYFKYGCNGQCLSLEGDDSPPLFGCGFELVRENKIHRNIPSNKEFLKIIGR